MTNFSTPEREVSEALAKYKMARISLRYRNWRHLIFFWSAAQRNNRIEAARKKAEFSVREVVNQSAEHQNSLRVLVSRQPAQARDEDNFLSLLN